MNVEIAETNEIPFTQYISPHGRKTHTFFPTDDLEMYKKAMDIIERGYRFESEILSNGMVSLTIFSLKEDEDVAIKLCNNTSGEVKQAVESLINNFGLEETSDSKD